MFKPILKWVGGKRKIASKIINIIKSEFGFDSFESTYFEPFLGGGSVFFELKPQNAVINDLNEEIYNLLEVIKNSPKELVKAFYNHASSFKVKGNEYYYNLRKVDRDGRMDKMKPIERAARTLFLNRFGFNGLYRVNNKGEFNVPVGRNTIDKFTYNSISPITEKYFIAVSNFLNSNNITIISQNYDEAIQSAKKGDVVYFDPPYDPISETSSFTGYTKWGFDLYDQENLRKTCDILVEKGVSVIVSNSDTENINRIYDGYEKEKITMSRSINSNIKKRAGVSELIIYKRGKGVEIDSEIKKIHQEVKLPQANDLKGKMFDLIQFLYENKSNKIDIDQFYNQVIFKTDRQKQYYRDAIIFLEILDVYERERKKYVSISKTGIQLGINKKISKVRLKNHINKILHDYNLLEDKGRKEMLQDYNLGENTVLRRDEGIKKWLESLDAEEFSIN